MARREEIAARLASVRGRIAAGCAAAGRDPDDVTLVVVTKTFPAGDVGILAELGVHDVGENRDQEAAPKAADCEGIDVRWHFIGQLQTNKAKSVTRYAHAVHSVDRPALVAALGRGARAAERDVGCFLQVSLDGDPTRGGALAQDLPELADAAAAEPGLRLLGLMAVAPMDVDPYRAFAVLPDLSERLRRAHPDARSVSAGMSGDLEAALACGATHLRVGSAVLGQRPPLGYRRNGV